MTMNGYRIRYEHKPLAVAAPLQASSLSFCLSPVLAHAIQRTDTANLCSEQDHFTFPAQPEHPASVIAMVS